MAMGVGLGGFLGGIIVSGGGINEYRLMFSIGALLVVAGGLMIWRRVPNIKPETRNERGEAGSWNDVFRDRWFIYAMLLLFALVLGFTQVQMSVPPFLRSEAGMGEGTIGALFLMNMLLVIIFQVPVAARVDRGNAGLLLAGAAAIWGLAFATMLLTTTFGPAAIGVFVFFTAGELIFMPASSILAVRLAPPHLRGRYFSLLSITWGGSFAIATLSAGAVLDTSRPSFIWPVTAIVMIACAVGALRLRNFDRLRPPGAEPIIDHADLPERPDQRAPAQVTAD
jgi:predicted MFS family arabinose efflux permease